MPFDQARQKALPVLRLPAGAAESQAIPAIVDHVCLPLAEAGFLRSDGAVTNNETSRNSKGLCLLGSGDLAKAFFDRKRAETLPPPPKADPDDPALATATVPK